MKLRWRIFAPFNAQLALQGNKKDLLFSIRAASPPMLLLSSINKGRRLLGKARKAPLSPLKFNGAELPFCSAKKSFCILLSFFLPPVEIKKVSTLSHFRLTIPRRDQPDCIPRRADLVFPAPFLPAPHALFI